MASDANVLLFTLTPREAGLQHSYEAVVEVLRPAGAGDGRVVEAQGPHREGHLRAGEVRGEAAELACGGNLVVRRTYQLAASLGAGSGVFASFERYSQLSWRGFVLERFSTVLPEL